MTDLDEKLAHTVFSDRIKAYFASRPLSHRVWAAFGHAMHAHRVLMTRRLAEYGGHPGQSICLGALVHSEGISQRDLAELLQVTRPTITVMLKRMERDGLVERRVDEQDQRYTRIYVTDKGKALHERRHEIMDSLVDAVVRPLSEADQRELERLLGLITANMQAALDSSQPQTDVQLDQQTAEMEDA